MVKAILLLALVALSGCQTVKLRDPDPTDVASVVVPVQCPAPKEVQRPTLADLENITVQSNVGEVVRAYRIALQAVKGYARELEEIVEGYRRACASASSSDQDQPEVVIPSALLPSSDPPTP